jgi:intracellular sulfur oxidation DsrE/DsrF family protein
VDVVLHFLFKQVARMTGLISTTSILLWSSPYAWSQATLDASANPLGYVARINNDSPAEVADALKRAEKFYLDGKLAELSDPLSIVLHGPEVEIFFKDKYKQYKDIVDLAARLSAFGVINLRVCETQAGIMGRNRASIHSFIGTVAFGPSEIKRLLNQQSFVYF